MVVDDSVSKLKKQRNLLRLVLVARFFTPLPKAQPTGQNYKKV